MDDTDKNAEQSFTQEDYHEAQQALLDWMLPIIQREATIKQRDAPEQHAA